MTRRTASDAIRSSGGLLLLLGLVLLAAGAARGAEDLPRSEDCLVCHADRDLKREAPARGRSASLFVDAPALKASAHAGVECVACHKGATAPHEGKLPPVSCAGCHDGARAALGAGIHGSRTASARGVGCASCHGTHAVRPATSLGIEACASCHREQVQIYAASIHGRSRRRGDSEAATCRSCHGTAHGVLAKRDPRAPTYHLSLPRTCAQCHADPALAERHKIAAGNVYQLYMDSIHGRAVSRSGLLVAANCSDCHGAHEIQARTDPSARVFRSNIPKTCGACHAGIEKIYTESVHAKAVGKNGPAAVCSDCHSAHQIKRVEQAPWQLSVIGECGTCHQESLRTYRDTFHGKVTALGFARGAKCADCHGSHGILPASDPRSTVSAAQIVATCRQCHPAATPSFARFHPHADAGDKARFPTLYHVSALMTGLLLGTFAFFGVHTALWLPRSLVERLRRAGSRGRAESEP
jgi:nitrate/TMAO reductase-like tetraheme cytochrome c subunit